MPLGVLVTLANPGAIASSHLFRRFESAVSSSSSSNSGDGSSSGSDGRSNYFDDSGGSRSSSSSIEEWYTNEINRSSERVPLDEDDSSEKVPLSDEEEESSLHDDYSLLYGLNIKSNHRRMRHNSGNSKHSDSESNARVGNHIRRSNNAFVDDENIINNRRLNYGDIGSDRDDSSSSPFDIINKPLIFSIPGL